MLNGIPCYEHDLFTNGIIYIDFAVDIRDVSDKEGLLLPFFSRMICSSGLPGKPYDQVALELAHKTGGLYTFLESSRTADGKEERKDYLFFRLKTLKMILTKLLVLFRICFLKPKFLIRHGCAISFLKCAMISSQVLSLQGTRFAQ